MRTSRAMLAVLAPLLAACTPAAGGKGGAATFAKSYGGVARDRAVSGVPLPGGGYLFAGTTNERMAGEEPVEGDFWVVELDGLGNVNWQVACGGQLANPGLLDVDYRLAREAGDGGSWLGGHEEAAEDPGGDYREDGGNIAIMRLDANGQPAWPSVRIYDSGAFPGYEYARPDGTTDEEVLDMAATADGGLLVASWTSAEVVLPDRRPPPPEDDGTSAVVEAHAVHVMKIAADGAVVWSRLLHRDENGDQHPNYFEEFRFAIPRLLIRETSDGGAIVGISVIETLGFVGAPDAEGTRLELQAVRLSNGGDSLWVHDYPNRWANDAIQIDEDMDGESDDGFVFAGTANDDFEATRMLFELAGDGAQDWFFLSDDLGIYYSVVQRRCQVVGSLTTCSYAAVSGRAVSTFTSTTEELTGIAVVTEQQTPKPFGLSRVRYDEAFDRLVVHGRDDERDVQYTRRYSFDLAIVEEFVHPPIEGCTEDVIRGEFTSSGDLLVPCTDEAGEYLNGVLRRNVFGDLLSYVPLDERFRMVEQAHVVLATPSDGVGSVDGYTVMGTSTSFLPGAQQAVWLVRIGLDGSIRWQRLLEGVTLGGRTENGDALDVFVATTDGGYALGAVASGSICVAGLAPDGSLRWFSPPIAAASTNELRVLAGTDDGGFVVAGEDGDAAWLARLEEDGAPRWLRTYRRTDSGASLEVGSIARAADGFVLAGSSSGLAWAMKVDLEGQVLWSRDYDVGSLTVVHSSRIAPTPDGGFVLGTTAGSEDLLPDDSVDDFAATGRFNDFLIELDPDGKALRYQIYGGLYDEVLQDLRVLDDGGILVSGSSESLGDYTEAWILRLGPDGLLSAGCNAHLGGGSFPQSDDMVAVSVTDGVLARDPVEAVVQESDTAVLERLPAGIMVARQCAGTATDTDVEPPPQVERFTLTLVVAGPGTGTVNSEPDGIICGPICVADFDEGTDVYLLAEPDGAYLVRWLGCDEVIAENGCLVTMDRDRTVYVNFDNPFATLTVQFAGAGNGTVVSDPTGIDCTADCEGYFLPGTQVFLHPIADPGSVFSHWEGCDPGGDFGVEGCFVTLDGDRTVTAHFE